MNEHKCKKCDNDLVWVGNIIDGHMECQTCKEESCLPQPEPEDIPVNLFSGRQSGRTHKKVLQALDAARGGPVIYVVHTKAMIQHVLDIINRVAGPWGLHNVYVMSVHADPRGFDRGTKVFLDHALHNSGINLSDWYVSFYNVE